MYIVFINKYSLLNKYLESKYLGAMKLSLLTPVELLIHPAAEEILLEYKLSAQIFQILWQPIRLYIRVYTLVLGSLSDIIFFYSLPYLLCCSHIVHLAVSQIFNSIYSLTVLQAESLKSRHCQSHTPFSCCRDTPFLPLSVSGGSWCS